MESTEQTPTLLESILPPRIEDAGLEDCALPPESIKEAFFKAASAVSSILSHSDDEDDDEENHSCLIDPFADKAGRDELIGTVPEKEPPGSCGLEGEKDDVVVVGEAAEGGREGCVEGVKGLEIEKEEEEEEEEGERPVLVEGYV